MTRPRPSNIWDLRPAGEANHAARHTLVSKLRNDVQVIQRGAVRANPSVNRVPIIIGSDEAIIPSALGDRGLISVVEFSDAKSAGHGPVALEPRRDYEISVLGFGLSYQKLL